MDPRQGQPGQQKYYDPAEVEEYVKDVTKTIKALQSRLRDAMGRADEAKRTVGEGHPDTAGLGRALLLAGEVADKTISDADTRAAEIVRAAEDRAEGLIEAAEAEARRLLDAAQRTVAETWHHGEARLLAAVGAFIDGSDVLRAELTRIQEEATAWRHGVRPGGDTRKPNPARQSEASSPPPASPSPMYGPPPPPHQATTMAAGNGNQPGPRSRLIAGS